MCLSNIFSPHHFIHNASIALYDLDHLIRNILVHIIRHRNAKITIFVHLNCHIHRLQQSLFINAGQAADHPIWELENRWEDLYGLFQAGTPGLPGAAKNRRVVYIPIVHKSDIDF